MFRTNRMIAAVTLALWASGTAAQAQPGGSEGPAGQAAPQSPATPQSAPPAQTPAPPPPPPPAATPASPPASPPAAAGAPPAAAQAQQQGTPATVLDTQDYESLLGRSVRSAGGDELGRVIDIIIDKEGHPRAAIIDFGGFLGVGTRKIAVDWRALRFTPDGGKERKLSVALTRNQVRVSPEYKSGEPIVVLGATSPGAVGSSAPAQPESDASATAEKAAVPSDKAPDRPQEKTPDK